MSSKDNTDDCETFVTMSQREKPTLEGNGLINGPGERMLPYPPLDCDMRILSFIVNYS